MRMFKQPAATIGPQVLQSAAAATGNGAALDISQPGKGGFSTVVFQLTGTFTATVTFEGTVDGTNWGAIQVVPTATGTAATTATGTGLFRADVRGLAKVRARVSAYTSGNVTVEALAVAD